MKIYVAQHAGFCFGVKRALEIAYETVSKFKSAIYTLGPLIHNPQVVEQLQEEGISPVSNLDEIGDGILIVRSHGLPPSVIEQAEEKGLIIVDATCPFVKQAQKKARLLTQDGYQVLVFGEMEHPEVKGILGVAGKKAICMSNCTDLRNLRLSNRIGVVAQTTQSTETLALVVSELVKTANEVRVFNTICTSTQLHQESSLKLARKVDCMVVVGGKNSANTKRLTNLIDKEGIPVYHIEREDELNKDWFSGLLKIGLTGGASTPKWLIKRVSESIKAVGRKA
ncbi:4-hydroxy-3-methylbut-2-enyl diphosphate reductase [candidate division WOR-3 bacterium]|nr:4-hydroxy-3-methylbut-2-enyl diphosphate reductase [candidate division WOR-3 bacterium]